MILIEHDLLEKILKEVEHIKEILTNNQVGRHNDNICWFNNAELMQYLRISRRTTLTLRKKGLPWKSDLWSNILS